MFQNLHPLNQRRKEVGFEGREGKVTLQGFWVPNRPLVSP